MGSGYFYKFFFYHLGLVANTLSHPRFFQLHQFVRAMVIRHIIPRLEHSLGATLILRHSAQEPALRYNFLFSDFDFDLVLENDQIGQSHQYCLRYRKMKALLPFLGEIEVYSKQDWELKRDCIKHSCGWYELFKAFRKIGWLEDTASAYQTSYHKLKRSRALKNALVDLGAPNIKSTASSYTAGFETLRRRLPISPMVDAPVFESDPFYCQYLAVRLSHTAIDQNARTVVLSPSEAISLLSLIPIDISLLCAGSCQLINKMRLLPGITSIWRSLATIELLTIEAFLRATPAPPIEIFQWKETLGQLLSNEGHL